MLRHVDLCSGIGGFALGFEWAGLSKPVMFCDIEPWSRKILAKHWPDVPIEEDVKVLANEPERIPECSILTAGYPCQPFSLAGKRGGEEDDRHIWPYIREIVAQKRPTWCVFENVYGHLSMGLDTVLSDLEADGYATRPFIVPACGVDAPHRRDRVWLIGRNVADTEGVYAQRQQGRQGQGQFGREGRWKPEPPVGRVANGIPRRVDRLRGLGNAIVPQIAMQIGLTIKAVNDDLV
jgi:DNA (cytosine-5)-methyltransferase 1